MVRATDTAAVSREQRGTRRAGSALLTVRDLHVYYGASHALQGVDLTLDSGVHAVVGRNGMGKTTLCNAILGLIPVRSGSIRIADSEVTNRKPHEIARLGVGYTPQGRRLWRSLTVDDHLKMCESRNGAWTVDRIYETFPRLAERRSNGGAQLSGGEQQMLAISRALLQDPRLLVLDEPTEGLAPVIVAQVEELLHKLADSGDVAILLVEQNIGVATRVADDVAIMANGQISAVLDAQTLGADRKLQQQLLGVGRVDESSVVSVADKTHGATKKIGSSARADKPDPATTAPAGTVEVESSVQSSEDQAVNRSGYVPPTRWSRARWDKQVTSSGFQPDYPSIQQASADIQKDVQPLFQQTLTNRVLVAGTFDTKAAELGFIADRLRARGVKITTVDLSTSDRPSSANVPSHHVASWHPRGASAVFGNDRGAAVSAMSEAFTRWTAAHSDIAGIISAGGSGGTSLATPAMRKLPIGVPKVMVSTVASGNVAPYVGPSDIMMMYSVTDVQGINRISRQVLGNASDALYGMLSQPPENSDTDGEPTEKPAIGLSMFGVTTPAVQQTVAQLEQQYECLVFHATGIGGQSMEKLADSGFLTAALDLTTTEVCDLLIGGVFPATNDRFGAFARTGIPYVGSVGALDMVNFGAPASVPQQYRDRQFVEHNPQVTLMRTTVEENGRIGKWIGEKLNAMEGPVRFLLPEGGVSALDAAGQPFEDTQARAALFDALVSTVQETASRKIIKHSAHINDPAFTNAVVEAFNEITNSQRRPLHATH